MFFRGTPAKLYEDLPLGHVIYGTDLTVTETHVVNFAGIAGDFVMLHMNKAAMDKHRFGARVAHGPLTLALTMGQLAQTITHENWQVEAALGVDDVRFLGPVFFNDTLIFRGEITDRKERGKHGIVTVSMMATSADTDAAVLSGSFALLVHKSAAAASS